MKKPKIVDLKVNKSETQKIRVAQKNTTTIKITFNIEKETLSKLKAISKDSEIPYQRLLNKLLKESLSGKSSIEQRIDKLEREIIRVKKILAA